MQLKAIADTTQGLENDPLIRHLLDVSDQSLQRTGNLGGGGGTQKQACSDPHNCPKCQA